jgi:deoxyadenosine/deoxycytidine kinase
MPINHQNRFNPYTSCWGSRRFRSRRGARYGVHDNTQIRVANELISLMHLIHPTQLIFLDADTNVLKTRWKRRASFEEKLDYHAMQRTVLFSLSKVLSISTILYLNTTTQTIKHTHELIIRFIENLPEMNNR